MVACRRREYRESRPHRSLDKLSPSGFGAQRAELKQAICYGPGPENVGISRVLEYLLGTRKLVFFVGRTLEIAEFATARNTLCDSIKVLYDHFFLAPVGLTCGSRLIDRRSDD